MERKEQKRQKFSPTSIEKVEKDLITRLCGNDNRYLVPDEFHGKEPTAWEQLSNAFPVPTSLQDKVQLLHFQLNYRGCPLFFTTLGCNCKNCVDMQNDYIPYAHGIMSELELDGVPTPGKPRRNPELEFEQFVPNDISAAVNVIRDYVHVYNGYCMCSHSNVVGVAPETPILTRVFLKEDPIADQQLSSVIRDTKWAMRFAMTPTRLCFKEKTD